MYYPLPLFVRPAGPRGRAARCPIAARVGRPGFEAHLWPCCSPSVVVVVVGGGGAGAPAAARAVRQGAAAWRGVGEGGGRGRACHADGAARGRLLRPGPSCTSSLVCWPRALPGSEFQRRPTDLREVDGGRHRSRTAAKVPTDGRGCFVLRMPAQEVARALPRPCVLLPCAWLLGYMRVACGLVGGTPPWPRQLRSAWPLATPPPASPSLSTNGGVAMDAPARYIEPLAPELLKTLPADPLEQVEVAHRVTLQAFNAQVRASSLC
eukprot:scaffold6237_cov336-Prasinococcus_capsulatus_cf.AAC.6